MELKSFWLNKKPGAQSPFNRTIVELKYDRAGHAFVHHAAFNRTIVELKCAMEEIRNKLQQSFNRTIVELKFIYWTEQDVWEFF